MRKLKCTLNDFLANESGATAIEYCLIAAAISLAIIGLVNALGIDIAQKFAYISSQLK
jgi:pilus assembly protein Flp/PilA